MRTLNLTDDQYAHVVKFIRGEGGEIHERGAKTFISYPRLKIYGVGDVLVGSVEYYSGQTNTFTVTASTTVTKAVIERYGAVEHVSLTPSGKIPKGGTYTLTVRSQRAV